MKHIFSIVFFLTIWVTDASWAQSGMAVYGKISIGKKMPMAVSADGLILEGDVTGEGALILAGKDTQTVVAHNHAIDHLVVANPKTVKVKGRLTIRKSLTVEQGNLTVEPHSDLTVLPGALVTRASGSKRMHPSEVIQAGKKPGSTDHQPVKANEALMNSRFLSNDFRAIGFQSKSVYGNNKSYREPDLPTSIEPPQYGLIGG